MSLDGIAHSADSALFVFIDESGDFNFSLTGTRYFFFGALSTRDPLALSHALTALRYQLACEGDEMERFHATEDRQAVRKRVFEVLASTSDFDFDALVIEKRKTHPSPYDEAKFYPKFAADLLDHVIRRDETSSEPIVLITDRLPLRRKRDAVKKALHLFMRNQLGDRRFVVLHHTSSAHACLQAADYCTWAIHRKWRDAELRPISRIRARVRSEIDIFATNDSWYY